MNKNEKFVITINRELGSGGRTVGEILAKKLQVPFYDKAVIKALQREYHLSVADIESLKGRKHNWWADFKRAMGLSDIMGQPRFYKPTINQEPDLLTTDEIFKSETEILTAIADDESCVIAGRSGFSILADHPNHLSILIQASMEHRIERVMKRQSRSREDAIEVIKKVDEMRENYVKHYTGKSRYDTRNYDLVISMDGKTEEQVADLILAFIG
ncbi:MAG: cytidylate kinase-like family protein [Prevotella sp.]|nr:cytidylate kinase-like family protein [Prevotella sp.]